MKIALLIGNIFANENQYMQEQEDEKIRISSNIALVGLLVLSGLIGTFTIIPEIASGYISHNPILIDGDADFAAQALLEGWIGNGTESNPYIIEGYEIDASSANGIEIISTTVWFVINNTRIVDGGNDYNGIYLWGVQNGVIQNCTLENNLFGISFLGSDYNNITGNNISLNIQDGIHLKSSEFNNITGNLASSNSADGIYLRSNSNFNNIRENTVLNNQHGIYVYYNSVNNNIEGNNASNNWYGIMLSESSNWNNIEGNTANSNHIIGIAVSSSINNNITNNQASNNGDVSNPGYGIYIGSSIGNNVTGNTMENNGIFILGNLLEYWNTNNIDTSNTVNGKPVYYWKDQTSGKVPLGAGQIILVNCTNVLIENQELINGTTGVQLGLSNNNTISGNEASYNTRNGFLLYNSTGNIFIANNISSNDYSGIRLENSEDNVFYYNNINDNPYSIIDTIFLKTGFYSNNTWNDSFGKGNYWGDYTGIDNDGDGVGDSKLPHHGVDYCPLMGRWPLTILSAPQNLNLINGDGYINLSWEIPSDDGGSPVKNYKIYRGTTPGVESYLGSTGNLLYYNDTSVTNDQVYYYRVSAVNDVGEGPLSDEVSATPTGVIALNPPSLSDPGNVDDDGIYTLSWSSVSDATSYVLEENNNTDFTSPTTVYSGSETSYQVSGKSESTYYYRVKATGSGSESGWSNVESIIVNITNEDEDGLSDSWEQGYFGNLDQEPEDDFDDDGYSNLEEYQAGTDPTNEEDYPGILKQDKEETFLSQYWWIIIIIAVVIVALIILVLRKKPPNTSVE